MELKQTALKAAKEAGQVLLELFKGERKYEMKTPHDILAEADLKSEKIIINQIRNDFPEHSILSEEEGEMTKSSDHKWIIDSLDGTINFEKGIEEFCISMAVDKDRETIFSLIYRPKLDKLYLAEKGKGAFLNEQRISVSEEEDFLNMLLALDNTSNIPNRKKQFSILTEVCGNFRHVRIFGSGSLQLARLAEGKIGVYYKLEPHYWDCAPGALLIKEAGGKISDFEGKEYKEESTTFLASNGKKHEELLEMFQKFL